MYGSVIQYIYLITLSALYYYLQRVKTYSKGLKSDINNIKKEPAGANICW